MFYNDITGIYKDSVKESKALHSITTFEYVGHVTLNTYDIAFITTHAMLDTNLDLMIEFSLN